MSGFITRVIKKLEDTTQKMRALRVPKPAPPPKPQAAAPGEAESGRVRHDERGNAVWDIAVATGVFALESTSRLLKRLDAPELRIEDDKELELGDDKGGGYDPYDRRR